MSETKYFTEDEISKIRTATEAFRSSGGLSKEFSAALEANDLSVVDALAAAGMNLETVGKSVILLSMMGIDPLKICNSLAVSVFDIAYRLGRSVGATEKMEKTFARQE